MKKKVNKLCVTTETNKCRASRMRANVNFCTHFFKRTTRCFEPYQFFGDEELFFIIISILIATIMASNSIPTKVDCVILGTGLTNSIIAAACSRIGRSVLHVDENSYYGDEWASFTFQQLIDWIKIKYPADDSLKSLPDELVNKSRMFCIDLCPKLLYSNGEMVDLLVKSNVCRYHDFKNNTRILSMVDEQIHVMPCSRNEVFTSSFLSDLIDKRKLMKFIELCMKFEPDENSDAYDESNEVLKNADRPISEFLTNRGISHTIKEFIINSIAMVNPDDPTKEACQQIKKFMISTERYGRSPFLFPLYGCGEFPQSFCRLSAVFGGVYCLNTPIDNVKITTSSKSKLEKQPDGSSSGEKFSVKFSNNDHEVKSDILVMDQNSSINAHLANLFPSSGDKLSRAILITKESLAPNPENLISFLRIPPSDINVNVVHLLELNSSVMVCPPDINIVYIWMKSPTANAKVDLNLIVNQLFKDDLKHAIIWKFFYQQLSGPQTGLIKTEEIDSLFITSPPSSDIDYNHCINEARQIFNKMCPEQEFLPRAPDPDEIITT